MRKYPHNLPRQVGYLDDSTIRKVGRTSLQSSLAFVEELCHHLMLHHDPMIVPIYDFVNLGYDRQSGIFRYQYDMKALLCLKAEEKRLINLVADRFDKCEEYPSHSTDDKIKIGWSTYPELMRFLDKVLAHGRYLDLHDGNIMIDEEDNYQIIDVEGFINTLPLAHPKNSWFMEK